MVNLLVLSVLASAAIKAQQQDVAIIPRDGSTPMAKRTNGKINTMSSSNGVLYFGGDFSQVDNRSVSLPFAAVNAKDGSLISIQGIPTIDGSINSITAAPNGDIFVGADSGLGRISGGQWKPAFPTGDISGQVQYAEVKGRYLGLSGQINTGSQVLSRIPPSLIQLTGADKSILCDSSGAQQLIENGNDGDKILLQLSRITLLKKLRIQTSGIRAIAVGGISGTAITYPNGTVCAQQLCEIYPTDSAWSSLYFSTLSGNSSLLELTLLPAGNSSTGASLSKLQLFAIGSDFNVQKSGETERFSSEKSCASDLITNSAIVTAESGGNWAFNDGTGMVSAPSDKPAEITISPQLTESGQYEVYLIFPACNQENNCQRSIASVEMMMVNDGNAFSTQIDQRQNTGSVLLYTGPVDGKDRDFQPSLKIRSINGDSGQTVSVVVDAVRFARQLPFASQQSFMLIDLNSNAISNIPDMSDVLIFLAGASPSAMFFNQSSGQLQFPPNGGLLGDVTSSLYLQDRRSVYVGGQFTTSADQSVGNLRNIARLELSGSINADNTWKSVGNGTDGAVDRIRYDPTASKLHLFGSSVLPSIQHAVLDLENGAITADENTPNSFDAVFDSQNIYSIGKFPDFPATKKRAFPIPWWALFLAIVGLDLMALLVYIAVRRRNEKMVAKDTELTQEEIKQWSLSPVEGSIVVPPTTPPKEPTLQHDTIVPTIILAGNYYSDESSVESMELKSPLINNQKDINGNSLTTTQDDTMTDVSADGEAERQKITPISQVSDLSHTLENVSIEIAEPESATLERPRSDAVVMPLGSVSDVSGGKMDRIEEKKDRNSVLSFANHPIGRLYEVVSYWGEIDGDLRVASGSLVRQVEDRPTEHGWIYAERLSKDLKATGEYGVVPLSVLRPAFSD